MILMWDKPKKKQSKIDWGNSYGFEDGPVGGYVPNMSDDDKLRWKAKITGKTKPNPQIEIRKSTKHGSQVLIIVSMGKGYNYKYYTDKNTLGVNVHISTNGPIQLSFEEINQMHLAIEEAKQKLIDMGQQQTIFNYHKENLTDKNELLYFFYFKDTPKGQNFRYFSIVRSPVPIVGDNAKFGFEIETYNNIINIDSTSESSEMFVIDNTSLTELQFEMLLERLC